jgi:hypothetical protein
LVHLGAARVAIAREVFVIVDAERPTDRATAARAQLLQADDLQQQQQPSAPSREHPGCCSSLAQHGAVDPGRQWTNVSVHKGTAGVCQ